MYYNSIMYQQLRCSSNDKLSEQDTSAIYNFVCKKISDLHTINGCVVARDPTFNVNDTEEVKRYVTDDVGLEASQNEINLNVEMDLDLITIDEALYFFETFNKALKMKYDEKFCSILSLDDCNCWIFRFHKIRQSCRLWINDDINIYHNPILYDIF